MGVEWLLDQKVARIIFHCLIVFPQLRVCPTKMNGPHYTFLDVYLLIFQNGLFDGCLYTAVLCLGQDFWGAPVSSYLKFQRDIRKFWGTHQFHLIFTCKIENSFPEISVHFYLHLSSMSIVLAQEGVRLQ